VLPAQGSKRGGRCRWWVGRVRCNRWRRWVRSDTPSGPCSRSVEEIVNGDSTCVVKGSVEEDENYVPVPIQFGYCRFPSCSWTTYHNCSGVPKKCPLWPRFLRYPRQKKRFMVSVNTRGQKSYLLASPQYASVLKSRQNNKNNQGQKRLLHWWNKHP